jgi:hypothetical protein
MLYQPEVIYLFLWSAALLMLAGLYRLVIRWKILSNKNRCRILFAAGILTGILFYYEFLGILPLITGFGLIIAMHRSPRRCIPDSIWLLLGALCGFFMIIFRETILRHNIFAENFVYWYDRFTRDLISVDITMWIILFWAAGIGFGLQSLIRHMIKKEAVIADNNIKDQDEFLEFEWLDDDDDKIEIEELIDIIEADALKAADELKGNATMKKEVAVE